MYSNFSMDNLEAFHNLSDIAKEHYLRYPNMYRANYLADKNSWTKIQGVFLQSRKYQDCVPSKYLAKYAEENDLPVIYFGE